MDNDKVYPKSQVYSHVHKSAFQTHTINNSNSINGKKHMYEIGTQVNELTQSKATSQVNQDLRKRVEELQGEIQQLSSMVDEYAEYEQKVKQLMRENEIVKQSLQTSQTLSKQYEQQNGLLQHNYQQLTVAFEKMKDEFEKLNRELEEYRRDENGRQDSKERYIEQLGEKDNIISELLMKLNERDEEYNRNMEKIQRLQYELVNRDSDKEKAQQNKQKQAGQMKQMRQKYEDMQQANVQLKQQIDKVVQLSLVNQKQLQNAHMQIQKQLRQQIHALKQRQQQQQQQVQNGKHKQTHNDKLEEIKLQNMEIQNQYLKNQLKLTHIQRAQQTQTVHNLQQQNKKIYRENKSLREVNNDYQEIQVIIDNKYKQKINSLEHELQIVREQHKDKVKEAAQAQDNKNQLRLQMTQVKHNFEILKEEVSKSMSIKSKYAEEIKGLKSTIVMLKADLQTNKHKTTQLQQISIYNREQEEQRQIYSNRVQQIQMLLMKERSQKQRQNTKYRQVIEDYKEVNESLTTQIKDRNSRIQALQEDKAYNAQLQEHKRKYNELVIRNEQILHKYKQLQVQFGKVCSVHSEMNFLKVDNSSLKAKVNQLNNLNNQYEKRIEDLTKQLQDHHTRNNRDKKIDMKSVQLQNRVKQYEEKYRIERDGREKADREHEQYRRESQQRVRHIQNTFHSHTNVKHSQQYRQLQNEIIQLEKKIIENEHKYKKSIGTYEDEQNKLKIENEFHKDKIKELHSQSYGIGIQKCKQVDNRQVQRLKNINQEINNRYQQLYDNYISLVNHMNQPKLGKYILNDLSTSFYKQTQHKQYHHHHNHEMDQLKELIDNKLIQLQLTPRQPISVIERTVWIIQKMSYIIVQYKKDLQIIRKQKKDVNKQNDQQKAHIERLQYENNRLLAQLGTFMDKYKQFQKSHYRTHSQKGFTNSKFEFSHMKPQFNEYSSKPSQRSHQGDVPHLHFKLQNDIIQHEARQMNEARAALIGLKKDIQSIEVQ